MERKGRIVERKPGQGKPSRQSGKKSVREKQGKEFERSKGSFSPPRCTGVVKKKFKPGQYWLRRNGRRSCGQNLFPT